MYEWDCVLIPIGIVWLTSSSKLSTEILFWFVCQFILKIEELKSREGDFNAWKEPLNVNISTAIELIVINFLFFLFEKIWWL